MLGEYPLSMRKIQPQMEAVFAMLKTCLHSDAEALLNSYLPRFGVDPAVPPAFVLFCARLFNSADCAVRPALFLMFIHLAMTLHNIPKQIQGRDKQLVILEGDYLYAHLFLLLCRTGCLYLLERFSRLIKEMNEGSVMRQLYERDGLTLTGDKTVEILGKQYGLFFAECCELGGLFAGKKQNEVSLLHQFGNSFGIAYGAQEAGLGPDAYNPMLDQAIDFLDALPVSAGKDDLIEFARETVISPNGKKFWVIG